MSILKNGLLAGEVILSDQDLIDKVARLWIENGGDAEGIVWCWSKIKDRIEELEIEDEQLHQFTQEFWEE